MRITDVEIVMHIVRLASSGNYLTVAELRRAAMEDFPNEPVDRIERCLHDMAARMNRS